jgi:CheY-like chemotaxis protein
LRSGFEVLTWARSSLKPELPVVILTSSNQLADIEKAYREGANTFLVKPGHPEQLVKMMKGIKSFWLGHPPFPTD